MRTKARQAWEARLQAQAASGLSIQSWCKQQGLSTSNFHYWRKQLAATPTDTPTRLIALPMAPRLEHAAPALELRTPQGYLIRLSSSEQVSWLGGVLEALR